MPKIEPESLTSTPESEKSDAEILAKMSSKTGESTVENTAMSGEKGEDKTGDADNTSENDDKENVNRCDSLLEEFQTTLADTKSGKSLPKMTVI